MNFYSCEKCGELNAQNEPIVLEEGFYVCDNCGSKKIEMTYDFTEALNNALNEDEFYEKNPDGLWASSIMTVEGEEFYVEWVKDNADEAWFLKFAYPN